jgi:hypothetical protein
MKVLALMLILGDPDGRLLTIGFDTMSECQKSIPSAIRVLTDYRPSEYTASCTKDVDQYKEVSDYLPRDQHRIVADRKTITK